MLEFIKAGGWIMAPIILCSVLALAIVLERFWTLRRSKVVPTDIPGKVEAWANTDDLDYSHLASLRKSSPLGEILAAALLNRHRSRDILKEAVEESGRHVVHEMQRFLNTLGTIADITPLLGLLGTVLGMIKVFAAIVTYGVGDANQLAGGISQALVTTAAGLSVAIPSLFFYRYFRGLISEHVVLMEQQAIHLIDAIERGNVNKHRNLPGA